MHLHAQHANMLSLESSLESEDRKFYKGKETPPKIDKK